MAATPQEVARVELDDSRLVRLRHVGEDRVHHAHQHAILQRVPRVLDDRYHVAPLLGHRDQVAPRAVRELHGVHQPALAHDVAAVRHCGARGCAQIKQLSPGLYPDLVQAAEDGGAQLGPERVPHTVLDVCCFCGFLSARLFLVVDWGFYIIYVVFLIFFCHK